MMSGFERFGALMNGQTPDQVPVVCNLLDQGARELGVSIRDYYQSGELVAQGQLALRNRFGYDTLLGMFYSALEAEVMGCRNIIYASDGPPNVGHLVIKTAADIARLHVPDSLEEHPRFREVLKCVRILKQESAGRYPVLGVVTASFSLPAMLMGIGPWLDLSLWGDQTQRDSLLATCSRFCVQQAEALRQAGADLIVYVNPVASATFIRPDKFRQLALEWILKDLSPGGYNDVVYFNGGGRINPILADIQKNTGIGAYYLNPFDNIREARQILGPQALIVGTINDIRLIDWTPEEIDCEVQAIIEAGKESGGFMFGTLLMPFLIPEMNIRAMINAVNRHGTYGTDGAVP